MVFLSESVIFLLNSANPLIKHFDGFLQLVGVRQPILLLELLHVAEIKLRDRRRSVFRLRVLVLDALRDGIDRTVHQLLEVYHVVLELLVVVHSLVVALEGVLSDHVDHCLLAFVDPSLKLIELFLPRSQLVVKLDVLGIFVCDLLLEQDNLLLHVRTLLVAHRVFLQLLYLLGKVRGLLACE